jgi:hypothetical protein
MLSEFLRKQKSQEKYVCEAKAPQIEVTLD